MTRPVIFVSGQDPLVGLSGAPSYVRTHARAAVRAGFEPHIFCVSHPPGVVEAPFGVIHRVRSRLRHLGQTKGLGLRPDLVGFDTPRLVTAMEEFIGRRHGPHLVHGFSQWGWAGVALRERMRPAGIEIVPVSSVYGSWQHACAGKLRGLSRAHGLTLRLFFRAEWLWSRLVVSRER